jgi:hypothetical protein
MRRIWLSAALAALIALFAAGTIAIAGGGGKRALKASLSGYQETPSISSPATGRFKAKINGDQIAYKLSYSGFTSTVTAAHIHFAQFGVPGGIAAFLCGGGGKPPCPQSGEISGTITATDVVGPADQGIAPGEIVELIAAMRAGFTYVNVHTAAQPSGEIRGQIGSGRFGFGKKHGFGRFGGEGDHGNKGRARHD